LFFFKRAQPIACFTLEVGFDFETNSPRTVLCGWTKEGTHLNFGDGPSPNVASFVEAIKQSKTLAAYTVGDKVQLIQ
jgi:hypothetical protein